MIDPTLLKQELNNPKYKGLSVQQIMDILFKRDSVDIPPPNYKLDRPRDKYSIAESLGFRFFRTQDTDDSPVECEVKDTDIANSLK